jgi:predicted metal-dependent phosphoesterase TrpH
VRAIVAAGGTASLAHPGTDCLTDSRPLAELQDAGLKALEVYHPRHTSGETERLAQFAKRRGLIATGGSDFHGENKDGVQVGDKCVGTDVVEALARVRGRA